METLMASQEGTPAVGGYCDGWPVAHTHTKHISLLVQLSYNKVSYRIFCKSFFFLMNVNGNDFDKESLQATLDV